MGDAVEGRHGNEPKQWTFWRKRNGLWHWRQTSLVGLNRVSAAGFRALGDGVANAMSHGYVPPPQVTERM